MEVDELKSLISEVVENELIKLKPQQKEIELLTRKEVSDLFKIIMTTLHSWINNGILTPIKFGGRVYYDKAKLYESIRKNSLEVF